LMAQVFATGLARPGTHCRVAASTRRLVPAARSHDGARVLRRALS
jgi:hypothetical protein